MRKSSFIIGTLTVMLLVMPVVSSSYHYVKAYLFFMPHNGVPVVVGHLLSVKGTSAPSNATRTKCNVQFRVDGGTYSPVIPLGKGLANYTKWEVATTNGLITVHRGVNVLEGKFTCFSASIPGIPDVANFIHHLTHNITGI